MRAQTSVKWLWKFKQKAAGHEIANTFVSLAAVSFIDVKGIDTHASATSSKIFFQLSGNGQAIGPNP